MNSEEIAKADFAMERAGEAMITAASSFAWELEHHRRWSDQWLADFKDALEKAVK